MTHGKLAQFKMSLLMLSRRVDGLEDLKEQVKTLTMSYSGIEDLAESRHSAYMLRLGKSEESLVINDQPVPVPVDLNQAKMVAQMETEESTVGKKQPDPVTVDVNHARVVAQIKTASEQHDISTIELNEQLVPIPVDLNHARIVA